MIHGDACFAYFNKIWGIPAARGARAAKRVYGRGPRARSVVLFGIASIGAAAKKQGD
jgi:hypothetical protein